MAKVVKNKYKNLTVFTDGSMVIKNVTLSYPHLSEPYAKREDDDTDAKFEARKKYSLAAMLSKDTHEETYDHLLDIIKSASVQAKVKVAKKDFFISDGDDSAKEEYEGSWVVNAREKRKPTCRSSAGAVISDEEVNDKFYAGCMVNVLVKPWVQNNPYGKKVNLNLQAVQFVADGERIGGGPVDDEGAFESYYDDSGDDGAFDDDDDEI